MGSALAIGGAALVGSVYSAKKQAKTAEKASKSAAESTGQTEAANRELNEQRMKEARQLMGPYVRGSADSYYQLGDELGLGSSSGRYVPGRDDVRGFEDRSVLDDASRLSPTGTPYGETAYLDAYDPSDVARDVSALAPGEQMYRDPTELVDQSQYFSDLGAGYEEFIKNPIYQEMIDAGARTAQSSAAAQGMARSGSALEALRNVGQETSGQFFQNYLGIAQGLDATNEARMARDVGIEEQRYANYLNIGESRADQINRMNENRYTAGQAQDEQRFANYMNIEESRDVNQRNVEESRYANYLNLLQNRGSSAAATNLASLGVNQAAQQGQSAAQATSAQNQYAMQAAAAKNASYADIAGGGMNLASAYMQMPQAPQQTYGSVSA